MLLAYPLIGQMSTIGFSAIPKGKNDTVQNSSFIFSILFTGLVGRQEYERGLLVLFPRNRCGGTFISTAQVLLLAIAAVSCVYWEECVLATHASQKKLENPPPHKQSYTRICASSLSGLHIASNEVLKLVSLLHC